MFDEHPRLFHKGVLTQKKTWALFLRGFPCFTRINMTFDGFLQNLAEMFLFINTLKRVTLFFFTFKILLLLYLLF